MKRLLTVLGFCLVLMVCSDVAAFAEDPPAPTDACSGVPGDQPEGTDCAAAEAALAAPVGSAADPLIVDPSEGWGRFQMATSTLTVFLLAVIALRSFGTRSGD